MSLPPMTELDVAKGIQEAIAGPILDDPQARVACLGLMSSLERSLDRIRNAEWAEEERVYEAEYAARMEAATVPCPVVIFGDSAFDDYARSVFGAGWKVTA